MHASWTNEHKQNANQTEPVASGDAGRGVAELLLDAEAEIDHQSKNGGTAPMFACQTSNVEVARLLLERGATQRPKNIHGLDAKGLVEWAASSQGAAVHKEELLALLASY